MPAMVGRKRRMTSWRAGSVVWKVSYSQRQRGLSPAPERGCRRRSEIWVATSSSWRSAWAGSSEEAMWGGMVFMMASRDSMAKWALEMEAAMEEVVVVAGEEAAIGEEAAAGVAVSAVAAAGDSGSICWRWTF